MLWRWPKKSGFECDKDDEFPFQTNGQRTTKISDLGIFYLFFRCWKLHKKSMFRRLYYGKSGVVPGSGAGKAWVVRGPGDFCGGNFGKVGKLKWVCLPPKLTMANSFLLPCAQLTANVGMFLWQLGRIRPSKTNMTKWKSPTGKESMYLLLRIGDFQAIVMSVFGGVDEWTPKMMVRKFGISFFKYPMCWGASHVRLFQVIWASLKLTSKCTWKLMG